jgi:hypothetical protein
MNAATRMSLGSIGSVGMEKLTLNTTDFRRHLKLARDQAGPLWEGSRKYVQPSRFQEILPGLIEQLRGSAFDQTVVAQVSEALKQFGHPQGAGKARPCDRVLRELTGLPPSKAVRAIVVWGRLATAQTYPDGSDVCHPEALISLLQKHPNPYALLCEVPRPSLLDIGAGDLTFEQELVEYYRSAQTARKGSLVLHAFDRLRPGSKAGGVYHRNPERERMLKSLPPEEVQFRFWGNTNLTDFSQARHGLARYTIVTCHAPANPTFAYEPGRLDTGVIREHLRSTRGEFRQGRFEGEPILEVVHRGQVLNFPAWKFEILGPLRLLEFIIKRGQVGILSAVDDEVFWELLSQLLADERYRPKNRILTPETRSQVFGSVFEALQSLKEGVRLDLSQVAPIRDPLPWEPSVSGISPANPSRLRYVEIRRGAVLPGVPGSFTGRQFKDMNEEATPWWVIMVTE